jgi:hypothetical protein
MRNVPSGCERLGDRAQHLCGLGLVVDRVEGGDELVPALLVERRQALHLERAFGSPSSWASRLALAMPSFETS